nr:hypothetical protein Iba_chr12cCG14510 [Ipomoea batatas]
MAQHINKVHQTDVDPDGLDSSGDPVVPLSEPLAADVCVNGDPAADDSIALVPETQLEGDAASTVEVPHTSSEEVIENRTEVSEAPLPPINAGVQQRSYLESVVELDQPDQEGARPNGVSGNSRMNEGWARVPAMSPPTAPYGPWMIVTRKERRQGDRAAQRGTTAPAPAAPVASGSRFALLDSEPEVPRHAQIMDGAMVSSTPANNVRQMDAQAMDPNVATTSTGLGPEGAVAATPVGV